MNAKMRDPEDRPATPPSSEPWTPRTLEDHLLLRYLDDHPGTLFLEVPVGSRSELAAPRRIDGVLVPGDESEVRSPVSYSAADLKQAVAGRSVHLLEAKRVLNRNVIGQVEVGAMLLARDLGPEKIVPVAVCGGGNPDLVWYCEQKGVHVALYDVPRPDRIARGTVERPGGVEDVRKPPDLARRRAFLSGWADAVAGTLYGSVRTRKTHKSMGNLFGWIYGEKPMDFRLEVWEHYVLHGEEDWERGS